ncbi:MAG TPA: sigma-54 dependent transcriptional regulator [Acidobacteriota bacterium]|nr:sigma-54 dependent transcriptional regulator [Acidobacteriota bacterium]
MKQPNVLLVDDDRNFLRVLTYHVREFGFHATPASSGKEALERLGEEKIDLVVTDLKMPEMDGIQLLAAIRENFPSLPVIVLTAHGSIDKAVEAIKLGAFDFLTKPFEKEEIHQTMVNALRMADLLLENRELSRAVSRKFEFDGLVGSSKKIREVFEMAQQLAQVNTTVLIQGESGTGKELLARAIHYNSSRCKRPFIVINCGALPESLIESELFGHRKGAFTGAVSDKKGKFEVADSGTVLLDEVAELPLNMQVRLLRVLQQKEIDVVGDPRPRKVDVRVIAAANRDLRTLTAEGRFREDLYYRLSVAPLYMPPLRERREDIPLLVHHFLRNLAERFGKEVTIQPEAMSELQGYDWPGNVRELENIVERLMVFNKTGVIEVGDLPPHLLRANRSVGFGNVVMKLPEDGFSLEELEKNLLYEALRRHGWNQSKAARYLGITRNTLIYRMQKFGLREQGRE